MTIPNPQPEAATPAGSVAQASMEDSKPARVFTQEELDAIVRERLARVEAEAKASQQELEAKLEAAKADRAMAPPAAAETPRESTSGVDAQALKAEAIEAAKAALYPTLAAEKAKAAAARLGFVNAEDATKMLDFSGFIVDGAISDEKIKEAVTALAKERPYLLASQTAKASEVGIGAYGTDSAEPALSGADLMAQVLGKK